MAPALRFDWSVSAQAEHFWTLPLSLLSRKGRSKFKTGSQQILFAHLAIGQGDFSLHYRNLQNFSRKRAP